MLFFHKLGRYSKMDCREIILKQKKDIKHRDITTAISLAEDLISSLKIKKFPIPIVSIMNDLGFCVYSIAMPADNISGFIMINPDIMHTIGSDKLVAVSEDDIVGRQRFTMAHELAHYLFDFNEQEDTYFFDTYNIDKSNEDNEKIPSKFAAEFLMPKAMFEKRFEELKLQSFSKYETMFKLVEDFQVSSKAVEKRLEELKLNME